MRKLVLVIILIALFMLGISACESSGDITSPSSSDIPEDSASGASEDAGSVEDGIIEKDINPDPDSTSRLYRAGFVTQRGIGPLPDPMFNDFQRLAPEYGFEMYLFAGENEPAVEVAGIETCIAEGYDAVFVETRSIEAIIPALMKAKDTGLVVGMFSSELPPEYQYLRDFFCGSDDYLSAMLAGQFVSAQFPDGANFVEVGGQAGHPAQINRSAGFRDGIADNIIELDAKNCPNGWNNNEVLTIMEDFLVRHGDQIDIVWCHWDNGAGAVIEAVQAAGYTPGPRPGEIYIIGVDGNNTGFQQVKDGLQALSVSQNFHNMIRKALENARIILDGGMVEAHNEIPVDIVTLETIDNFRWPDW